MSRTTKIALIYTAAEDVKTLTERVKSCATFAESKGWAVRDEVVELGKNYLAPEAIPEILEEASALGFHILVLDSLSRLNLDEISLLKFLASLEKNRRHMACIDEDIFTWSETGKFNLFATIALGRHRPAPPLPALSVAVYCSSRSGSQESIDRQIKACETRILMKGWSSKGVFTELKEALTCEADALMAYSLDRFPAEDHIQHYEQLKEIEDHEKHLLTVFEGIDTRDKAGRGLFGLHVLPFQSADPVLPSKASIVIPGRSGRTPKKEALAALLKDWLIHKANPASLTITEIAKKYSISNVTVFNRLRLAIIEAQNEIQNGETLESLSRSRGIPITSLQYAFNWIEVQESKKAARIKD